MTEGLACAPSIPPTTLHSSLFTIHCVKVSFTLTPHEFLSHTTDESYREGTEALPYIIRAKRYRGPRKVLRSKLFGERRNKCSKLKRFAREPFSLAKFVWTSGCSRHSHLRSKYITRRRRISLRSNITCRRQTSLRESFFHANRPIILYIYGQNHKKY